MNSRNTVMFVRLGADKTFPIQIEGVWFNKPFNAHRECTTPGCCGKNYGLDVRSKIQVSFARKMNSTVEEFICNTMSFRCTKEVADWVIEGPRKFKKDSGCSSKINISGERNH
jgi:NADH-quinone oxidoreductase subunit G